MSILKFRIAGSTISDLEYVTKTAEASSNIKGICTDGTYVFQLWNQRITRFLCSDMSFVDMLYTFNGSDSLNNPVGITVYANWLYVACGNGIVRFTKDLVYVDEISTQGDQAADHDESYLYVSERVELA